MNAYTFYDEDAVKYGVNSAIILYNFKWWIKKNIANETNFKDGRTWTYNSTKALSRLFPFFTQKQITYAINNLEKRGAIIKRKYNISGYNHTIWYALVDESPITTKLANRFDKIGKSIRQNCQNDMTKLANRYDKSVKSFTYSKHTDNNHTDNNKKIKENPPITPQGVSVASDTSNELVMESVNVVESINTDMINNSLTLQSEKTEKETCSEFDKDSYFSETNNDEVNMSERNDNFVENTFNSLLDGGELPKVPQAVEEIVPMSEDLKSVIADILDYFNRVCKTKFRNPTSSESPVYKDIKKLFKVTGCSVRDIKIVIWYQNEQWQFDEKMRTYLRPSTLFRLSKFENYLGKALHEFEQYNESEQELLLTCVTEEEKRACRQKVNESYVSKHNVNDPW